jgi:hypothetical protein
MEMLQRSRHRGVDVLESLEPYGPAATGVAQQQASGEVIGIEVVDSGQQGRLIGQVEAGGTDLAASPALSGHDWPSRQHDTSSQIKEMRHEARQGGRGLWSQDDPASVAAPPRLRLEPPRETLVGAVELRPALECREGRRAFWFGLGTRDGKGSAAGILEAADAIHYSPSGRDGHAR